MIGLFVFGFFLQNSQVSAVAVAASLDADEIENPGTPPNQEIPEGANVITVSNSLPFQVFIFQSYPHQIIFSYQIPASDVYFSDLTPAVVTQQNGVIGYNLRIRIMNSAEGVLIEFFLPADLNFIRIIHGDEGYKVVSGYMPDDASIFS